MTTDATLPPTPASGPELAGRVEALRSEPVVNTYRFSFSAICPADGARITYRAEIATPVMIRVEEINSWRAEAERGYHEQFADALLAHFGGTQRIVATHQGVQIETVRS